jgi:eukaryotic-like serine/threonine-protein kinase
MTTTVSERTPIWHGGQRAGNELDAAYHATVHDESLVWPTSYRKIRLLGSGGQGVVYLTERQGSDEFRLPVALKIFSPQSYRDATSYNDDMRRVAATAARVAQIQHDNLLDIHNFVEQDGIRLMEMEWVDGYDLRELLAQGKFELTRGRVEAAHWQYLNDVVITAGPSQARLKPGVAIQVLRECLAGLAALHREGIVHGDLKPSNIMLKRTGHAKVIDIGSAIQASDPSARRFWSPAYAAPEVLEGSPNSVQSDLASLGYVLIEMLAGVPPFGQLNTYRELIGAKQHFDRRLCELLPEEVCGNEILFHLCQRLIAPDPPKRFPSAEAADLDRQGAANFHRQLVKGDLASEYENDIRVWLEALD